MWVVVIEATNLREDWLVTKNVQGSLSPSIQS